MLRAQLAGDLARAAAKKHDLYRALDAIKAPHS